MKRYLFYYGYLGTRFRGVEIDLRRGKEDRCISKYLLKGVKFLNPINKPYIITSSRTDAGVHAICSTFHCNLELNQGREIIRRRKFKQFPKLSEERYITSQLNNFFCTENLDIRIHKTEIVPFSFNCRGSAIQRTYLYRLAHRKNRTSNISPYINQHFPIAELNRCYFVDEKLDIEAVRNACDIIKGNNEFRAFYKKSNTNEGCLTKRTLDQILLIPGRPFVNPAYDTGNEYDDWEFLDIIISSRSFLYNQVRRLVGYLVAIGKGQASLEDLKNLFSKPGSKWDSEINIADAHGLYLLNIKYPPEAFIERPRKILSAEHPLEADIEEESEDDDNKVLQQEAGIENQLQLVDEEKQLRKVAIDEQ